MSRDPERLLRASSDADSLERELLASLGDVSPHPHAKEEAWTRIAAQMSAVALVTGGMTAAAGHAAASSGAMTAGSGIKSGLVVLSQSLGAKLVLAVAVTGIGAVVAARQIRSPDAAVQAPKSQASVAALVVAAPVEPPRTESELAPHRVVEPPTVEAREPNRASVKRAARDDIAVESTRLAEARAELRRGNAKAAQAILTRLRSEFPRGALGQEREVLAIEVLSAQGNSAAVRRRVQAFIGAHPNSPHNAALTRFLGD